MDKQAIAKEINKDIEKGIYTDWPKVQRKLEYIAYKLVKSLYVDNCEEISDSEIKTLKENCYIDKLF